MKEATTFPLYGNKQHQDHWEVSRKIPPRFMTFGVRDIGLLAEIAEISIWPPFFPALGLK